VTRQQGGPPAHSLGYGRAGHPPEAACDRCGGTAGIPIDSRTGEPIRSREFEAPGTPVTWPMAILCTRCVHELRGVA
jgi:hypothetical protein